MEPLAPRDVAHLFRPLLDELLALLRGLTPDDWNRSTIAAEWRVRDVAAHLLDGDFRKLAICRDGHAIPTYRPIETDRDLASFINGLNATGVAHAARLSPRLLTDLLEVGGGWIVDLFTRLPPHGAAIFPVSWAGERASENWMDIGREYTERWHHQMQIRDAVSAPLLLDPRWMEPLLEFSVRALPHVYAGIAAPAGTAVTVRVHGPTEGGWSLVRADGAWTIVRGQPASPDAMALMDADSAWRLFYNALSMDDASARIQLSGDARLLQPLLHARSVIV